MILGIIPAIRTRRVKSGRKIAVRMIRDRRAGWVMMHRASAVRVLVIEKLKSLFVR